MSDICYVTVASTFQIFYDVPLPADRSLRVPQSSAQDRIERVIILLVRVWWKSWRRRAGLAGQFQHDVEI